MRMLPADGSIWPRANRKKVLFPVPFGPVMPRLSPFSTSNERFSKRVSSPKDLPIASQRSTRSLALSILPNEKLIVLEFDGFSRKSGFSLSKRFKRVFRPRAVLRMPSWSLLRAMKSSVRSTISARLVCSRCCCSRTVSFVCT